MKILKFGGSSVGDASRINSVIKIITENYLNNNEKIAVVFSAFQGITDKLIELGNMAFHRNENYKDKYNEIKNIHYNVAKELVGNVVNKLDFLERLFADMYDVVNGIFLVRELTPRTLDYLMSFGERLSCNIIAYTMNKRKLVCEFLDSTKIIKTDNNFGAARVNFEWTNKLIQDYFKNHRATQIVTGFIASTEDNEITTLGRGGSDYTASILGAALKCEEIQIWTDVNGILTSDPRIVPDAIPLKAVTYEEAMELSHFGAKVIHPPTMAPALKNKIKIRIKNTFNPEFKGTVILEREAARPFSIKGISSIENISLIRIQGSGMVGVTGIASRIFSVMARKQINIILITQASSEHSICFAILPSKSADAKAALEEDFKLELFEGKISNIEVIENLSIIAVVGEDMRNTPGVSGLVFNPLGKNGINIEAIAHGSSQLNISLVIHKKDLHKALIVLHQDLFKFSDRTINLFMVGPGSVGKELINLMIERRQYIKEKLGLNINTILLANSKKMIFNLKGIDLEKWSENLSLIGEKFYPDKLIQKMVEANLPNSVFVDCTANDTYVKLYEQILNSSISIVTPNKIANTLEQNIFETLHQAAKQHNVKFNYNTNVGAALPIINTIKELINNGDEILEIEGVLSGSLSFIFNMMNEGMTFSEAVFAAQQKAYTEPDPRDDLSGLDNGRKLLILIREIGVKINLEQIEIENLVPKSLQKAKLSSSFYEELSKLDSVYNEKLSNAKKRGNRLIYLSRYKNGKGQISVEEINKSHPFYNLRDRENIISLTTRVYNQIPLTIRGAGAGSKYTAYGILMDILRIIN